MFLVDRRFCSANADHSRCDLFPAAAAAHAVHRQAGAALVAPQGFLGAGAEQAVDAAAGLVAQCGKRVLQDHHIAAPAPTPQGGVARCGAAAGRGAVAAVKVHPCGGLAQGLHIAPGSGGPGGLIDGCALALGQALAHIKGHAGVMLAAGAVTALPTVSLLCTPYTR